MTDLPEPRQTEPLTLTLTVAPPLRSRLAARLASRALGRLRNGAVPLVPALGAALLAVPAGWVYGISPAQAATVGLCGCLGAVIGFLLLRRSATRHNLRALSGSALQTDPVRLTLDATGLTLAARHLPWQTVLRAERMGPVTLILFSEADALLVPDADLPPGLTPDDLAARIAGWKAA